MNTPASGLEIDQVHAWRGDRHVLQGVSAQVRPGELLLISGANGAGKTTLLRIISGLSQPERGSVRWSGVPITRQRLEYQAQMAFSAHEPALKGDLTALENLRFAVALRRPVTLDELRAALQRTGVGACADLPARVLSAGQRRRVAMARVVAMHASIWLLDEPFANLDGAGHELVSDLLRGHVAQGGIGLVVAHHEVTIECRSSAAADMTVGARQVFFLIVRRELALSFRRPEQLLQPLVFFLIVTTLFPLGLDLQLSLLRDMAPGALWVAALLSSLLSVDALFKGDADDGTLEQLLLSGQSLTVIVMAKTCAHWLLTGLPLVLVSPLVATALNIPGAAFAIMMLSLSLGTLTLSWLGAIGAGLTVGLRRGNVLLSLIVLPLAMPLLIFGAGSTDRAISGASPAGALYFLAALCVLTCTLAPFATTAALRITLD